MADKGGYQILKDIYDEFGIEYTEWDLGVDNADHNHPVHRYNRGRFNIKTPPISIVVDLMLKMFITG